MTHKFGKWTGSKSIGYLSALVSSALFGSISTLAKPALENTNPLALAAIVSLIASLFLTLFAGRKRPKISKKNFSLIILVAVLGTAIAPSLYFIGLGDTTASEATIIANSEIIFTVILALVFFKERLGRVGYIAIALVMSGLVVISVSFDESGTIDLSSIGNLLILLAMIFWAFDNNISKIITKQVNVTRIVQLKAAIGSGALFVIVGILGIPIDISLEQWTNVVLLGIFGFAAPMFLFYHAIKRIGTIRTVVIFSTSAIFGVFYANVFLHESITSQQIIALGIMLIGITILYKDNYRKDKLSDAKEENNY